MQGDNEVIDMLPLEQGLAKTEEKPSNTQIAARSPNIPKAERIAGYVTLLAQGIDKDELLCHLAYEGQSPEQMVWDVDAAMVEYTKGKLKNEDSRQEMMVGENKVDQVRAHIAERADIARLAKHNGELNISLDAIRDVAKLQNLYDETTKIDTKIEFVFSFQDGLDKNPRITHPGAVIDVPNNGKDS